MGFDNLEQSAKSSGFTVMAAPPLPAQGTGSIQ
jgi:hypothetical protein